MIEQLIRCNPLVLERGDVKVISTSDSAYNYIFNYYNGIFLRCGRSLDESDDPPFSPLGPEIADIEISEICHGTGGQGAPPKPCSFCYKSNTPEGRNMSLATFKQVFSRLPKNLCQIAFGIGDIAGNPDLWAIMEYCRTNGSNRVIPNITINGWGLTHEGAQKFASVCGAVAVSHYDDDVCFNAVEKLGQAGLRQVNIHQLVAHETFDQCMGLIEAVSRDPRLARLNAVVFLALKQKGRGTCLSPLAEAEYQRLVAKALAAKINFGFDSCSAPKFLRATQGDPRFAEFKTLAEPCESMLFSIYINVEGYAFPCSFCEGEAEFPANSGLDVAHCRDFLHEIWMHPQTQAFRARLLQTTAQNSLGCRECPIFNLNRIF
jgi:hypothetical protein